MNARRIRVLIVDDSAIIRKVLTETLAGEPDIEVVATAPDAYTARDKILALRPDVITLDLEMPRMDGLTFLRQLMFLNPIPTLIISSQGCSSCSATFEALRVGAVDVVLKPATPHDLRNLRLTLAQKIRAAAAAHPRPAIDAAAFLPPASPGSTVISPRRASTAGCGCPAQNATKQNRAISVAVPGPAIPLTNFSRTLIAIGASTGGTVAIQEILTCLPAEMPPILITQHIPAGFSSAFAERLNRLSALEVREATSGDLLRPGLALLAPGDHHLVLRSTPQGLAVELNRGPEVCYLRPSVDVMFSSIAELTGDSAVAVLLTGMGTDGARGMLALRQKGAATIAQDEASSVVYGMPREAVRLGAAEAVASLTDIPTLLTRLTRAAKSESAFREISA
jgi:two-component system chemotaxis response regulator CheB